MRGMQDRGTFSRLSGLPGYKTFRKVGANRIFLRLSYRKSEKKADGIRPFLSKRAGCGRFCELTVARGISTMGGDGIPQ